MGQLYLASLKDPAANNAGFPFNHEDVRAYIDTIVPGRVVDAG